MAKKPVPKRKSAAKSTARKQAPRLAPDPPKLYESGAIGLKDSSNIRFSIRGRNLDSSIVAQHVSVTHGRLRDTVTVRTARVVTTMGVQVLIAVSDLVALRHKSNKVVVDEEVTVTVTNPSTGQPSDPIAVPVENP